MKNNHRTCAVRLEMLNGGTGERGSAKGRVKNGMKEKESENTTEKAEVGPASSAAVEAATFENIHAPPLANGNKFAFLTLQLRAARGADERRTGAGIEQANQGDKFGRGAYAWSFPPN